MKQEKKQIKKIQEEKSDSDRKSIVAELGRQGGLKVAKKRGKEYMRELGKRGAKARWAGKEKKVK